MRIAVHESLMPRAPRKPEQAIVFTVTAWDANCPQHIPRLYDPSEMAALEARLARDR